MSQITNAERRLLRLTGEASRGGVSVGRLIAWADGGRSCSGQVVGFNDKGQIVAQSARHSGWYLVNLADARQLN